MAQSSMREMAIIPLTISTKHNSIGRVREEFLDPSCVGSAEQTDEDEYDEADPRFPPETKAFLLACHFAFPGPPTP
jgi:hypothetical protein